jgi:hypothetical protein
MPKTALIPKDRNIHRREGTGLKRCADFVIHQLENVL